MWLIFFISPGFTEGFTDFSFGSRRFSVVFALFYSTPLAV